MRCVAEPEQADATGETGQDSPGGVFADVLALVLELPTNLLLRLSRDVAPFPFVQSHLWTHRTRGGHETGLTFGNCGSSDLGHDLATFAGHRRRNTVIDIIPSPHNLVERGGGLRVCRDHTTTPTTLFRLVTAHEATSG